VRLGEPRSFAGVTANSVKLADDAVLIDLQGTVCPNFAVGASGYSKEQSALRGT
jgi:hypothetical protein